MSSPVSTAPPLRIEPGTNCWRVARADRASVIVDAAGYFRIARDAMLRAQSQILMIGWDFDTRIDLIEEDDGQAPVQLGPLLSWLVKHRPGLRINILAWDGKIYSFLGRGTTLFRLASWRLFRRRIRFKLDAVHPLAGCHHHKILVIDDAFACAGGIDMTGSRWDTRDHRNKDPRRRRPTTGRRYGPWHDATMAVDGEAAKALGDLGRRRWQIAVGERLSPPEAESDPWPEELIPQFHDVDVAIARTCGKTDEVEEAREIEALFVDMIHAARRFIYIESQYFAARAVAEAIAAKLATPDPPEIVVINPKSSQGFLEEEVMGAARAELLGAVAKADRLGRFRIYSPVNAAGTDIYVHAKIMIADDRMLRVGSANLNNRSMGLDSECDLMIGAAGGDGQASPEEIGRLRCDLVAEHLGVDPAQVARSFAETDSLIDTIERLRGNGRTLLPFSPPDYDPVARAVARSEVADPEGAEAKFEPMARRKLLRGLPRRLGARVRQRSA